MRRKVEVQETLLSAVARKLGRAAGTLANMTQRLTDGATNAGSKEESAEPSPVRKRRNRTAKKHTAKPAQRTAKTRTALRRKTTASRRGARRKR